MINEEKNPSRSETFFNVDWEAEFEEQISQKDIEILTKVANKVVEVGMTAPAIMFLASVKPMNYIGSQLMLFFEPYTAFILGFNELVLFRRALSKRESIEILIDLIEKADAEFLDKRRSERGPSFFEKMKKRIFRNNK